MLRTIADTIAFIAVGMVCSGIGVVMYWPFEGKFALVAAIIVMALLCMFWLFIVMDYAREQRRRHKKHWFAELVYLVVSFGVGFAIPLVLTGFGTSTFHVEATPLIVVLVCIMIGATIIVKEARRKPVRNHNM